MIIDTDTLQKVNLTKTISQIQTLVFAIEKEHINKEDVILELRSIEKELLTQKKNNALISDIANALSNSI